MIEMVRRYLRQKLGSPGIVIAMAAIALISMAPLVASGGRASPSGSLLVLFVLAAACVSRDASSGGLQMILARPIRRSEYLLGRYVGIAAAYALFLVATLGLAVLVSRLLPSLAGPPLAPEEAARSMAGAFFEGMLVAAVLLFFSTFLPGYADLLGYFLLILLIQIPNIAGQFLQKPAYVRFATTLKENVQPEVPWAEVLSGQNVLREALGRYVLALTAFLAAALIVFSRREFAYGQD